MTFLISKSKSHPLMINNGQKHFLEEHQFCFKVQSVEQVTQVLSPDLKNQNPLVFHLY